jgi:uncharacterized membrane protein YccC
MFVPREKQACTAGVCRPPTQCEELVVETSNQVRHRLRSSWEDRTPHRSQVAAPTVLPRRRRRLSRNEPANRFACSTAASRLESKGPSGTITNLQQRPRFPVHARKIHMQTRSGLAARNNRRLSLVHSFRTGLPVLLITYFWRLQLQPHFRPPTHSHLQ